MSKKILKFMTQPIEFVMEEKPHSETKPKERIEEKVRNHVAKQKESIETLLIQNLIKTNMTLLKSLDIRSIVLF